MLEQEACQLVCWGGCHQQPELEGACFSRQCGERSDKDHSLCTGWHSIPEAANILQGCRAVLCHCSWPVSSDVGVVDDKAGNCQPGVC